MKKHRRVILVLFGDTHAGHKLALMAPGVELIDFDEKGNPKPWQPQQTASQEYLWKLYLENIAEVRKIAGRDEIIPIHNGDLAQGNKHLGHLVSNRLNDQLTIAAKNMEPWLKIPNVKSMRLSTGTEAHNFGMGAAEMMVVQLLSPRYPEKSIKIVNHGLEDVNGVTVDFAHHGPQSGSRTWLTGNVARYYLQSAMLDELRRGNIPPMLYSRAHYHRWLTEEVRFGIYTSRIILTPSYCMLDDHARKSTQSISVVTNGLVVVEIIDGKMIGDPIPLTKELDIRSRETL